MLKIQAIRACYEAEFLKMGKNALALDKFRKYLERKCTSPQNPGTGSS